MQFLPLTYDVSNANRQLYISDVNVVANNTERDALVVQEGDVCKVTDTSKTFIFDGAVWVELSSSITNLNDMGDVTLVNTTNNQAILFNATNQQFENITLNSDLVNQGIINIFYQNSLVSDYLLTILTASQSLLTRNALGNLSEISIGGEGTYISSTGGNLTWSNFNTSVNNRLKGIVIGNNEFLTTGPTGTLTRLQQPLNDGMFITTISLPTKRIVWSSFSIDTIPNLQTALDGKIDESIVTASGDLIVGNGNASVIKVALGTAGQVLTVNAGATSVEWADSVGSDKALTDLTDVTLTAPTTGEILRKTNGDWTNQILDTSIVQENGNEYYTNAKFDTRLNSKYSGKGRILIGSGNNTFVELDAPTTSNQILTSSGINNVLNPGGLLWEEKSTTLYPLRAPNGSTAAPSFSFANSTGTGFYINTPTTSLNFCMNGVDIFWAYPDALQLLSKKILNKVGTIAEPSYSFNNNNNNHGFSLIGGTNIHTSLNGVSYHDVSSVRTRIANRLDIVSTEFYDNQIRINNVGNSFSISNSAGSTNHLRVDTGTNPRVVISENKNICAHHSLLASTFDTNIIANNTWALIEPWNTNDATIYGSFATSVNGTITVGANSTGTYKVTVDVSCLVNDAANVYFRLSRNNNTTFIPGMATVTANNIVQSCSFSSVTSLTAGDVLRLATTSVFGTIPKIVTIHTCSITITNIFNT